MTTTSTSRRQGVNSGSAIKVPCRAATTANITLSGEQSIDGISCVTGDRVLVKDQTAGANNGIYVCDTSTWQRDKDWDGASEIKKGTLVFVHSGTANLGWWYVSTADPITIGTTSVTIARASTELAVISAFAQTILDDTTAGLLRATLGIYSGHVLNTGTASSLPAGWSSAKIATGEYAITHNFGSTNYDVTVNVLSVSRNLTASFAAKGPNDFTVLTHNLAAAPSDAAFNFILILR